MEPIIEPRPVNLIEQELTSERLLRRSNKADNLIYVVDAHNSPNTMREIGRLREISFRSSGGGTGKSCDIDEFDTMPNPCKQLLVWNPDKHEIIGAYRFIGGWDVDVRDGLPQIAMGHMFRFSDRFLNDILPVTIELGRSFVRPEYQSTREGVRALFALDNLWDGLGALTIVYPKVKYMFGKMTMYPSYDRECVVVLAIVGRVGEDEVILHLVFVQEAENIGADDEQFFHVEFVSRLANESHAAKVLVDRHHFRTAS